MIEQNLWLYICHFYLTYLWKYFLLIISSGKLIFKASTISLRFYTFFYHHILIHNHNKQKTTHYIEFFNCFIFHHLVIIIQYSYNALPLQRKAISFSQNVISIYSIRSFTKQSWPRNVKYCMTIWKY